MTQASEERPAEFVLTVRGDSMRFLLTPGSRVLVRREPLERMRVGDLVILLRWRRNEPQYIVHRLWGRFRKNGVLYAVTKGDSHFLTDPPTPARELSGRVVAIGGQDERWLYLDSPGPRRRGLLLAVAAMALYQGGRTAGGGLEGLLRAFWACWPGKSRSTVALALLLRAQAWREGLAAAYFSRLQSLFLRWVTRGTDFSGPAPRCAGSALKAYFGILDRDQTWSGNVRLEGDLYVPPGVTLTIAPGTLIDFNETPHWTFAQKRPSRRGWSEVHHDEKCSILVAGRLMAEGLDGRRIVFGRETDWGGLHFLGGSRGSVLERVDISRSVSGGVSAWDGADLALRRTRLSRNGAGLSVEGWGHCVLEECEVEESREAGCAVGGPGRLTLRRTRLEGNPVGVSLRGPGSQASLESCRISASARAGILNQGGILIAADCAIERNAETGAYAQGGGSLELRDCEVRDNRVGIGAKAGRLELKNCRLRDNAEAGLDIDEGRHLLDEIAVSGSRAALSFSGREIEAKSLRIENCDQGVVLRGGLLSWTGGAVNGGRTGLEVLSGARARLTDVDFLEGQSHGITVAGGTMEARGLKISGRQAAGIYVEKGGSLALEDSVLESNRFGVGVVEGTARLRGVRVLKASEIGISLEGGRHLFKGVSIEDCPVGLYRARGVEVEGLEPASGTTAGQPGRLRSLALGFVLRTRRLPLFKGLYRFAYSLPVRVMRSWAAADENMDSLWTHRSWPAGEWEAGTSDIDLLIMARDLSGGAGREWLERFWRRFARWKSCFPFIGETLVMEPGEMEDYLRWGGMRARELPGQALALHGRSVAAAPRHGSRKSRLEPAVECAHAYTSLMQRTLWERSLPWDAAKQQGIKAALDLLRYGQAFGEGLDSAPSRRSLLAGRASGEAGDLAMELARLLRDRGDAEIQRPAFFMLCARTLIHFHGLCAGVNLDFGREENGEAPTLRWALPIAERGEDFADERQRRLQELETLRRRLGDALVGVCGDDIYRCYVIVDDQALEPRRIQVMLESLAALRAEQDYPSTLPVLLSRRLWTLWSHLPYLEDPLLFLNSVSEDGAISLFSAGRGLRGFRRFCWGTPASYRSLPDGLVVDMAKESLATLRCAWRLLGSPSTRLSSVYGLHYLEGRVMGLRLLLERGLGMSLFNLDALAEAYGREFPEDARALEKRLEIPPGAACDWACRERYEWADRQLRLMQPLLRT